MARHKQPRTVAALKGATSKDPQRYRGIVPEHKDPVGDAPEYMDDDAKLCWAELSGKALPGVMTHADSNVLEIAANLVAEYRRDVIAFPIGKYTHMIGCLARLGMSPADRQKLSVEKKDETNPYAHLKPSLASVE